MRRLTGWLVISLALLAAPLAGGGSAWASSHGAAQSANLDEVNVRVQPEYDDPRVLTVIEAKISDDAQLPQTAEFLVPKSAAEPEVGMACELLDGQGHSCKAYSTKDAGDFTSLTYGVTSSRKLFFEYYWDPFKGQAEAAKGKKAFKYEYKAPADVKTLNIGVQEPIKAEGFMLDPAPSQNVKDTEGLKTNTYTFSNVKKGEVVAINANYVKTDPALSKPKTSPTSQETLGSGGAGDQGAGSRASQGILLLFAAVIAAVIAAATWRSRAVPMAAPVGVKGKFCPACGASQAPGVKICSECGDEI